MPADPSPIAAAAGAERSPEPLARAAWGRPPGPVDRESFFAAQARHRRAAWRLTVAYALSALLVGVALAPILTPPLVAAVVLGADLVNVLVPTPDLLPLQSLVGPQAASTWRALGWPHVVAALVLVVLPGALALLLAWLAMRSLFQRAGVDLVLDSLQARPPAHNDLEERQLENLVAEMGIAAGLEPPALRLLDVEVPNAAVLARPGAPATLVVTRGLLARLDRDATQGVVAHLVAAVGNGDPRSAFQLLALFRAYGLATALLSSPYGPEGRRTLWRLLRWAVTHRAETALAEAQRVDALLARAVSTGSGRDDRHLDRGGCVPLRNLVMLPFFVVHTAFWVNEQILSTFLLGPLLSGLWRTRRHLADADAVQLTRHPDGLARALAELGNLGDATAVAGAGDASHLFVVWPPLKPDLGSSRGFAVSLHPPIPARLRRLVALGASASCERPPLASLPAWLASRWTKALLMPLGAALLALFVALGAALTLASLALTTLYAFAVVGPLHYLLRYVLTA